jgi:Uma2 family endonuclease
MAATLPLALDIATLERVVLRPGPEFTEDDFFEFCQEHSLLRIERSSQGELIIMAPSGFESGFIQREVFAQLREWAKKDGRGIVAGASSWDYTARQKRVFAGRLLDSGRQMGSDTPKKRQRFAPLVPAFVIKIRSPSDRKKDLQEKMQTYLRN